MTLILCTCSTDLKESLFQFMKCSMWWYLGICNRVPQRHMCRRSSRRPWSSSAAIYIYIYLSIPYIWLINTSSTTSISYIQLSKLRAALYESIDRPDIMAFVGKMNEITSTTGTGPKRILVWPVQLIQLLLLLRRQSGRQTAPMKKSFSSSYKHPSPLL